MSFAPQLDHVAFLVESLEDVAGVLTRLGLPVNPAQKMDGEGTLERYVGAPTQRARLLLLEAVAEGPYLDALLKRGPGLHHIAVNVPDLPDYRVRLLMRGWEVHPRSVEVAGGATTFFKKTGVPVLIEAQERAVARAGMPLIQTLDLPFFERHARLLQALEIPELRQSPDEKIWVTSGPTHFSLQNVPRTFL